MRYGILGFLLISSTLFLSAQPPELKPPIEGKPATPVLPKKEMKPEDLIARLIDALVDSDTEVRQHLGTALAKIGSQAVPGLLVALQDSSRERRAGAAYALGQMRPAPKEALPYLLDALNDQEELVRRQVAYAISRIVERETTNNTKETIPPIQPVPELSRRGQP